MGIAKSQARSRHTMPVSLGAQGDLWLCGSMEEELLWQYSLEDALAR
jgi:hypothetical protein